MSAPQDQTGPGGLARFSPTALMIGNFAMGMSVLGPAGMLPELANGLSVTIRDAGLLVTYGAIVLCFGSPLVAWLTSRIDRRVLLAGVLLCLGICNLLSALAPNYLMLVAIRVVMMICGAVYTPQAASAVGLLVPEKDRASAISYVFIGWSMAVALGLPFATFLAAHLGWRVTYGVIGVFGIICFACVPIVLPRGLHGATVSFRTWTDVFSNRAIMLLLLVTLLMTAGQFGIFVYLGPLLIHAIEAGPREIAGAFLISGVIGFIGNVLASNIVRHIGPYRTSQIFLASTFAGTLLWTFNGGAMVVLAGSLVFFGLGFAAVNSMQQGRLVSAAPNLAGASVALNTSAIYTGQAIGSAIAGALYSAGAAEQVGYSAVVFVACAFMVLLLTRPKALAA